MWLPQRDNFREEKAEDTDVNLLMIDNDFKSVEYVKYEVEEVIDDLPESFQKLDFVAVQRMGMIEQDCSPLFDDCPVSLFEVLFTLNLPESNLN